MIVNIDITTGPKFLIATIKNRTAGADATPIAQKISIIPVQQPLTTIRKTDPENEKEREKTKKDK